MPVRSSTCLRPSSRRCGFARAATLLAAPGTREGCRSTATARASRPWRPAPSWCSWPASPATSLAPRNQGRRGRLVGQRHSTAGVVADRALVSGDNTALDLRTGQDGDARVGPRRHALRRRRPADHRQPRADRLGAPRCDGPLDLDRPDGHDRATPGRGRRAAPSSSPAPRPAPASSSGSTPRVGRTGRPTVSRGAPRDGQATGRCPASMRHRSRAGASWSPTRVSGRTVLRARTILPRRPRRAGRHRARPGRPLRGLGLPSGRCPVDASPRRLPAVSRPTLAAERRRRHAHLAGAGRAARPRHRQATPAASRRMARATSGAR